MIARIWHGITPATQKEAFTNYLQSNYICNMSGADGSAAVHFKTEDSDGWTHYYVCGMWYSIEDAYLFNNGDITSTNVVKDGARFGLIEDPFMLNIHVVDERDPFRQSPVMKISRLPTVHEARQRLISMFSGVSDGELLSWENEKPRVWRLLVDDSSSCVRGEYAREAFDSADKQNAMMFRHDMNESDLVQKLDGVDIKSALSGGSDVYVIGENFLWLYVRPNNLQFGPFFAYAHPIHPID